MGIEGEAHNQLITELLSGSYTHPLENHTFLINENAQELWIFNKEILNPTDLTININKELYIEINTEKDNHVCDIVDMSEKKLLKLTKRLVSECSILYDITSTKLNGIILRPPEFKQSDIERYTKFNIKKEDLEILTKINIIRTCIKSNGVFMSNVKT